MHHEAQKHEEAMQSKPSDVLLKHWPKQGEPLKASHPRLYRGYRSVPRTQKTMEWTLLKKGKPKEKHAKANASTSEPVIPCCLPDTGGKAGKTVFPVLVGHKDYLYKSSKNTKDLQATHTPLTCRAALVTRHSISWKTHFPFGLKRPWKNLRGLLELTL